MVGRGYDDFNPWERSDDAQELAAALDELEQLKSEIADVHDELGDLKNERVNLLKELDGLRREKQQLAKIIRLADQLRKATSGKSVLFKEYDAARAELEQLVTQIEAEAVEAKLVKKSKKKGGKAA